MVDEKIMGIEFYNRLTSKHTLWMGTSSPVPGAASKFLPGFCSLGRVKVRDVQIGAWEVEVGGAREERAGMGKTQRMPSSCKRTWHSSQSVILFPLGRRCQGEVVRE